MFIKLLFPIIALSCFATSCYSGDKNKAKQDLSNAVLLDPSRPELTPDQEMAFDAHNQLQTRTDQVNRFYSTFANLDQPCYPADTTFEISQSEFLFVLRHFITIHCQNVDPYLQEELAEVSVLAQDKYTVNHCWSDSTNIKNEEGFSMTGTWVLPNVLGRKDVIMVW